MEKGCLGVHTGELPAVGGAYEGFSGALRLQFLVKCETSWPEPMYFLFSPPQELEHLSGGVYEQPLARGRAPLRPVLPTIQSSITLTLKSVM